MWSDRREPARTRPRPDGTVRLWVEQLDSRCLPSGGWSDGDSFTVGPGVGVTTEDQPVFTPPPVSDFAAGGDVFLPPPPVTVSPEPIPQPDGSGGGPMGGFGPVSGVKPGPGQFEPVLDVMPGPVTSYLPLMLPSPTFDGPLFALPEVSATGRTAVVDWGDGAITDAEFAPDVDGWLSVRVNRELSGNATYNVNVRLTAMDDPKDWLEIRLQVMTPPGPSADGPGAWNVTGYWPPMSVRVSPAEWLWVSLPVFEFADPGPVLPGGGGFEPPPPSEPTTPSGEPPSTDPDPAQIPLPDPGPALPNPPPEAPATPAGPFTSPPGVVTAPITPPVVHPASYSPFEAGATRAALTSPPTTPPRTPPTPDPVAPRAGTRPADTRADEKPPVGPSPVADSTPADEPESWDWVVALGVGPLELAATPAPGRAARSGRSDGTSDRGAKDHDRPPPAPNYSQEMPDSHGTEQSGIGTADLWLPSPEAGRLLNPRDTVIARQPGSGSAGGSPEAILAALADAPAPDAVFADVPAAAESSEDRRERWGWQSGAMALAAAVWAGVWFLWPRLGPWVRPVDPGTVAPDGPTLTRAEVVRPNAPKSAELAVEPAPRS